MVATDRWAMREILPESADFRAMESILILFSKFFLEKSKGKKRPKNIPNEIEKRERG